jgi:galactokinase
VTFDSQLASIQELVKKAKILLEESFLTSIGTSNSSTNGTTSSSSATSKDQDCYCTVAPGRVNLIGEHVDYTGGFVLPFAIEYSTVVYGYVHLTTTSTKTTNNNNRLRVVSDINPADILLVENFTLKDVRDQWKPQDSSSTKKWTNYIIGIVKEYLPHLLSLNPGISYVDHDPTTTVDIAFAITSNVPLGSGLSSSASLLVSVATFMEYALGLQNNTLLDSVYHNIAATTATSQPYASYEIPRALKCQQVEYNFCSTPCGIMDQFVSSAAQLHTLLLIDCEQQTYTAVQPPVQNELDNDNVCFVICNSHVKHDNTNGEYPIRVQQCYEALMKIQSKVREEKSQSTTNDAITIPTSLRHVTLQHLSLFDTDEEFLSSTLYKRVRHVVTENQRVLECATAFRRAQWDTVGNLMSQSHQSMKHDYEVSCDEIDSLVEWANTYTTTIPGRVYGSRLTGGGFGGCTVTLCDAQVASTLIHELQTKFYHTYSMHCTCFITKPQDGARRVLLPNLI